MNPTVSLNKTCDTGFKLANIIKSWYASTSGALFARTIFVPLDSALLMHDILSPPFSKLTGVASSNISQGTFEHKVVEHEKCSTESSIDT